MKKFRFSRKVSKLSGYKAISIPKELHGSIEKDERYQVTLIRGTVGGDKEVVI